MSDGLDPKPSPSGPFDKRLSKGPEGEGMGLAAAPGGNHLHSACKSRPEAAAKISVGAGFYPARGRGRAPPLQIIAEPAANHLHSACKSRPRDAALSPTAPLGL